MTDYSLTAAFQAMSSIRYDDALGVLCITTDASQFWTWNVFAGVAVSTPIPGAYMLDADVTADGRYALLPNWNASGANQIERVDLTTGSLAPFTGVNWSSPYTRSVATTQSGLALGVVGALAEETVVVFDPNASILSGSSPLITLPPPDYSEQYPLYFNAAMVSSEHHRYVLIQAEQQLVPTTNLSGTTFYPVATRPTALYLYDSASGRIVAENTAAFADHNSNLRLDQAAGDDVSEAAGLVEAASGGAIYVFDLALHPIATLTAAGSNFLTAHFSASGHQLFAWDAQSNDVAVFDTGSWRQVGVLHAGPASDGQMAMTIFGNLGQMAASLDGRMLFLQDWSGNQSVVEAIDLSARLHLTVTGDASHTQLYGSVGSDTITGSAANDTIDGGGGDDVLDGGGGINTASFASAGVGVTVSLASQGSAQTTGVGSVTLSNFQNLIGSAYADHLTGDAHDNLIDGGGGNDVLDGGGGTNTIAFASAPSGVTVSLALQGSAQNTGVGSVTLSNFQNLTGSAFADRLTGDAAANVIDGGGEADIIHAGAGDDTIIVKTGQFSPGELIDGGDGTDTFDVQGSVDLTAGTITNIENLVFDDAAQSASTITVRWDQIHGPLTVSGGPGADTLVVQAPPTRHGDCVEPVDRPTVELGPERHPRPPGRERDRLLLDRHPGGRAHHGQYERRPGRRDPGCGFRRVPHP